MSYYSAQKHVSGTIIGTRIVLLFTHLIVLITVLAFTPTAYARGGGGGHGGMSGGSSRMDRTQFGTQKSTERDMRLTRQQRNYYQDCVQSVERAQKMAQNMAQAIHQSDFDLGNARNEHDKLQRAIQSRHQDYQRFVGSLSEAQRVRMRNHLAEMDRIRTRVESHFDDIERELNHANPSQKRMLHYSDQMEKAMIDWENRFQKTGDELGMKP